MRVVMVRGGVACVGLLALVLTGCADKPTNRPQTIAVTGKVMYKGNPLNEATVAFVGPSGKERGAVGRTDKDGKFKLTTFEPGDGVLPGSYRVTVAKTAAQEGGADSTNVASTSKATPPKSVIPEKYSNPNTSGLTAEVKEGGPKEFTFELKD